MKKVAIIQARMGSTRLPGKILSELAGHPVLWHVVDRLSHCQYLDQIVVATTDQPEDEATVSFCQQYDISYIRGSAEDVLDRYYKAAAHYQADLIIRITADCPVIDPVVVDEVIHKAIEGDYSVYGLSGEFPDGLDVSLFTFEVLEKTWKEAMLPSEREHVGPYMSKLPVQFRKGGFEKYHGLEHHRWTLDEPNDLRLLNEIFNRLYKKKKLFLTEDILQLLDEEPALVEINASIVRNEGYLKSLKEDQAFFATALPQKVSDHTLYQDKRFYSSFPAVARLRDGNILLIFRRARETRHLLPSELSDELDVLRKQVDHVDPRSQLVQMVFDANLNLIDGPEVLPADPEAADQDASLLMLKNGSLLLGSFSWYPVPAAIASVMNQSTYGKPERTGCSYLFWGGNTRRSFSQGKQWEPHTYLPPDSDSPVDIGDGREARGGAVRGQPVEVDEAVLLPVYNNGCHLYRSTDSGASWVYHTLIARDESGKLDLNEPALYQCPSGKLICFIRSEGGDDRLVIAESMDGGDHWGQWRETAVVGHPFHPLQLPDGRIFLVYGYRHTPYGIRARIIDSEGEKIDSAPEIVLRDDGWCGDLGYPWSAMLDEKTLLVVYYFTAEKDEIRHIAATTLSI